MSAEPQKMAHITMRANEEILAVAVVKPELASMVRARLPALAALSTALVLTCVKVEPASRAAGSAD